MMHASLMCLALILGADTSTVPLAMPQAVDPRLKVELFAADPDLVTPCGIAVDAHGNVLVVESHTHFRPENYEGPPTDRIRLFADTDGDGRADRITTFHEGSTYTMNVAVHPDGSVYVATRMEIVRLRDRNNDGRADESTPIAHLETKGNYPHNGLSGFAFDFAGNVYFGLGENLGAQFKLVGTDGSLVSDLEGGQIYRCRADGSQVKRVAFGFWNPFHVAFDAFGRLFAVDNDPDSMPPCRLLHIVEGGNYGYRYRNGRKGVHPFTAWNGELPGTLPMVAGTGEAPSGVVAYESDQLPADYIGNLLTTSWGDHRVERYRLEPRGASFQAVTEAIVKGDENFRPVGIAVAPDGSLFVSDWVLKDYNLHRKGRLWRIFAKDATPPVRPTPPEKAIHAADRPTRETAARELLKSNDGRKTLAALAKDVNQSSTRTRALAIVALASRLDMQPAREALLHDPSVDVRLAAARVLGSAAKISDLGTNESSMEVRAEILRHTLDAEFDEICWQLVSDNDAFVAQAARYGLYHLGADLDVHDRSKHSAQQRLATLLIFREYRGLVAPDLIAGWLRDPDSDVRFAAVQWVGEERLEQLREPLIAALTAGPATARLFGGYLSALERLDGVTRISSDEWGGEQYIVRALEDPKTGAEARRWALRMLRPDHPLLSIDRLRSYLASDDAALQLEAVRSLRDSPAAGREALLAEIATSDRYAPRVRAEAIVGISPLASADKRLLIDLAGSDQAILRNEALRSLRGATLDEADRKRLSELARREPTTAELVSRVLTPSDSTATTPKTDVDAWVSLLHGGDARATGDPEAGERIFFHRQAAACARCHQIGGRGARVGPELTATARVLDERRLIESIVQPSKEVAPHFVSWLILTTAGQPLTGVLVHEEATGEQTYADQQGKLTVLKPAEIESRRPQATSLMPDGLPAQMTTQEFRDLLAFLRGAPAANSRGPGESGGD